MQRLSIRVGCWLGRRNDKALAAKVVRVMYGHIKMFASSGFLRLRNPLDSSLHNIALTSSATLKSASVFDRTSSTVTPSAISTRVRPVVKSTSKTHSSVIMRLTQAFPVRGNSHCFKIFGRPFLSVCSIVMTTFVSLGFETRSIAPPKPLIFPGSIPVSRLVDM